jgi:hypothetical protein
MRGGKRRKGEKRREEELIVEVAPELCMSLPHCIGS